MLLVLTLVSFPFLYFSLDLPKTIINRAIGGKQFPQEYSWLRIRPNHVSADSYVRYFYYLYLSTAAFKYYINTFKGRLGERMLRRFRYQLYQRMLRFPLSQFSKTSSAQIIPMITSECESLGGFIGDAFVTPAFQGGTLLTIIFFMFMQDPVLGAAAVALYPLQGYVIPKLQRKVNQLGKRRVRTVREVADQVQESAAGIVEIHANDAVKLQLTVFANLARTIYDIRFEIYQRKFFVKFLNNFIAQLTPFFFYSIGGYLVIRGNLSFGALVAVLAAYKDLGVAMEGTARFLSDKGGFADQVRADRRAVPTRRDDRRPVATGRAGSAGAADRRAGGRQFVARRGRQQPRPRRRSASRFRSTSMSRSSAKAAAARTNWRCCSRA